MRRPAFSTISMTPPTAFLLTASGFTIPNVLSGTCGCSPVVVAR